MIKRGDIYFADLAATAGNIQIGKRPVVILSNNTNNMYSGIINVVPLTTKLKKLPCHCTLSTEELKVPSQVLCEQILSIKKECLEFKIGKVSNCDMDQIEKCIRVQLGM